MEVTVISPKVSNFLMVKLDKNILDYLWRIIDIAEKKASIYFSVIELSIKLFTCIHESVSPYFTSSRANL